MTRFAVLDHAEFQAAYDKAFVIREFSSDSEKEAFREKLFAVRETIVNALERMWDSPQDFETAWDFDYCCHLCGGIYSERIFCRDYVETLLAAMNGADPDGVWTYHAVCEIETDRLPAEDFGEMFFRGGVCVIDASTMTIDRRRRLGCTLDPSSEKDSD